MTTPQLAVIVVSYNTRELTLACLRSLRDATSTPHRLVVVDNASTDGSAAAIAHHFPHAQLIASDTNLGFARANNLAARNAPEQYLLLLNPDTLVLHGAIDRLLAFARSRPDAGIWGGRTRFPDASPNPTSYWGRPTPWSLTCQALGLSRLMPDSPLFNPEALARRPLLRERRVDVVSGCFFLIRRELWERLEGFDTTYFMYGEETDLCLRARSFACRPAVTPDAEIVHHGGASERRRADKLVRLLSAKATLIRAHWSPAWARYGVAMLALWALTRSLASHLEAPLRSVPDARAWPDVWRRRREWWRGYPLAA